MNPTKKAGLKIQDSKDLLVEYIVAKQIDLQPVLSEYNFQQKRSFYEDTEYHLSYLAESLKLNEPILFEEYIKWVKIFFSTINLPPEHIIANFKITKDALRLFLNEEDLEVALTYLDNAIDIFQSESPKFDSYILDDNPFKDIAQNYLNFLIEGNKDDAAKLIYHTLENGATIKDIYLNVFQVTQKEVGRLWQLGKIFVAQEHFITAATQFIMSRLYPYMFSNPKQNKKICIACINGELHELGPRMIADLFELNGWDAYYFGANTPQLSLIKAIALYKVKVIAISATMTYNLSAVEELILKIRNDEAIKDVKIIVGGYPFNLTKDLWRNIGADGYASNFDSALALANYFYIQ